MLGWVLWTDLCTLGAWRSKKSITKTMSQPALAPVEHNYMETLAKAYIIPARQNQFIQEIKFNNAPIGRIAIAKNSNSAFTGWFAEKPFWYQQFNLRDIRILRGGQPVVHHDTTYICGLFVTRMEAMISQERYSINSSWEFQKPLCSSVWSDFNARCYWTLSLSGINWRTTEVGAIL